MSLKYLQLKFHCNLIIIILLILINLNKKCKNVYLNLYLKIRSKTRLIQLEGHVFVNSKLGLKSSGFENVKQYLYVVIVISLCKICFISIRIYDNQILIQILNMREKKEFKFVKKLNKYFKNNIKLSFNSGFELIIITNDDLFYQFNWDKENYFKNIAIAISSNENKIKQLIDGSIVSQLCNKQIIDINISVAFMIALTIDGKIYCCKMKTTTLSRYSYEPTELSEFIPVLYENLSEKCINEVSLGINHMFVKTVNNEFYGWGQNDWKEIIDDCDLHLINFENPIKLSELNGEKIKTISCGTRHTLAQTESGCVYGWGRMFLYKNMKVLNTLYELSTNGSVIIQIQAGDDHSILLSSDGIVYDFNHFHDVRKVIELSEKIIEISTICGQYMIVAMTESNKIYVWGDIYLDGKELIEPTQTDFDSIENAFAFFVEKNYRSVKNRITLINDKFTKNGYFEKFYKINKCLGFGFYGQVFEVRERIQGESVSALKIIKLKSDNKNEFINELMTCALIRKINSKNIIQYHDIWIENNVKEENDIKRFINTYSIYIKMDLMSRNLNQVIIDIQSKLELYSDKNLTDIGFYVVLEIFIQIVNGVNDLHSQIPAIIHRDLKPDNIMIRKVGNSKGSVIKINDCGLAALHRYVDQTEINGNKQVINEYKESLHTTAVGTIDYMDSAQDRPDYDTKVDIFSLGLILLDLFNFDKRRFKYNINEYRNECMNRLPNNQKTIIKLCSDMLSTDLNTRPDCQTLLRSLIETQNNVEYICENRFRDNMKESESCDFHIYELLDYIFRYKARYNLIFYNQTVLGLGSGPVWENDIKSFLL